MENKKLKTFFLISCFFLLEGCGGNGKTLSLSSSTGTATQVSINLPSNVDVNVSANCTVSQPGSFYLSSGLTLVVGEQCSLVFNSLQYYGTNYQATGLNTEDNNSPNPMTISFGNNYSIQVSSTHFYPIVSAGATLTLSLTTASLNNVLSSSFSSSTCKNCFGRTQISSGSHRTFTFKINNTSSSYLAGALSLSGLPSGFTLNPSSTCGQYLFSAAPSSLCQFVLDYVAPTVGTPTSLNQTLIFADSLGINTTSQPLSLTVYPQLYGYFTSTWGSYGFQDSNGDLYYSTGYGPPAYLYRSQDGGASWTSLAPAGTSGNTWGIQKIQVTSSGVIYIATVNGVWASSNGGATWINYTSGLGSQNVQDLYVDGSGKIYAATMGGLSISTNGGTSFTNYTTATGLGNNITRIIGYIDNSTFYVATNSGLSKTTNGGTSFTNAGAPVSGNWINGLVVSGSNIYLSGQSSGVFISTNGGSSFTQYTTSNGLPSNTVLGIAVDSSGTIYVTTSLGLSISKTGGTSWVTYTTGFGSNIQQNRPFIDSNNTVWVVGGGPGGQAGGLFAMDQ